MLADLPVLSLATSDRQSIVRFLPDEERPGATAVLVVASGQAEPKVRCLLFEGVEYPFEENGWAALPGFPAADVSIVLR
jgi:hypothetical protein